MSESMQWDRPETIGEPDDLVGDEGLDGGEEQEAPDYQEQLRALEQRLQQYEAKESTYQQTINQLLQGRQQEPQEQEQGFSLDDLPDPVEKPDEFKRLLQDRIKEFSTSQIQQVQQRTQAEFSHKEGVSLLDRKFRERYGDLAEKELLLGSAAAAEFRAAGSLDNALRDPDGFVDKVAERMRRELGQTGSTGNRPPKGRTAGASGGTTGNQSSGGGKQQPAPGFLSQLKKAQMESGLI